MSTLPFVVQPKRKPIIEYIGSEESGQIAIERRGYLSSGEKSFVQQALGVDETSIKIIGLSRKVSSVHKVTLDEAYKMVIKVVSGQSAESEQLTSIEQEYFSEFNDLLSHLANVQSREQILKALCLVQYRINPEFEVSDILTLHPDIISGLSELYNDEELRSVERLTSSQEASSGEEEEVEEVSTAEKKPRRTSKAS